MTKPVHDAVVDYAARLVTDDVVPRPSGPHTRSLNAQNTVKQPPGALTPNLDPSHVRDVEQARVSPHSLRLRYDPIESDRHLPARELHEPCSQAGVNFIESGATDHGTAKP